MKYLVLFLLKFYKKFLSSNLVNIYGGGCRFTPTCSEYAYDSVKRYGVFKGLYLAVKRIMRCNIFSDVKFDPVR